MSIQRSTGGTFWGALIDRYHVLTAAQLVYGNRITPTNVVINVNYDAALNSQITASQIFIHRAISPATRPRTACSPGTMMLPWYA